MTETAGMVGWHGTHTVGERPAGVHPWAFIGGPPEHRQWKVGDPTLEPVIHPTALIHAFVTVDAGMTYRQTTTVGARTFLQHRVHIAHNVVVGADCEICDGTVVCGDVTIGDGVRIGGNSWVKPLVVIGDGAIIGGGSVVTKDIPPHEVWCGNPARKLKLAWTHPQYESEERVVEVEMARRGLEGRLAVKAQYDLSEEQWQDAQQAVASDEISQRQRAARLYGNGGSLTVTAAHPLHDPDEMWKQMDPTGMRALTRGLGYGVDGDFA